MSSQLTLKQILVSTISVVALMSTVLSQSSQSMVIGSAVIAPSSTVSSSSFSSSSLSILPIPPMFLFPQPQQPPILPNSSSTVSNVSSIAPAPVVGTPATFSAISINVMKLANFVQSVVSSSSSSNSSDQIVNGLNFAESKACKKTKGLKVVNTSPNQTNSNQIQCDSLVNR